MITEIVYIVHYVEWDVFWGNKESTLTLEH